MCGIFGFITSKPSAINYDLLCKLATESADRGTDATGISYFSPKDKKFFIKKNNVDSGEFQKSVLGKIKGAISKTPVCIGHCRKWTTGSPDDNNNNHPIFSKDFIMVHNGACIRTPKIKNYKYMGTVDSELILAQVQVNGFCDGLEKSDGSASLAFLNRRPKEKEIILYRHNNPLWLAYCPDYPTVWFASTDEILDAALNDEYVLNFFKRRRYYMKEIPEHEVWKLTLKSDKEIAIKMHEYIYFGKQWSWAKYQAGDYGNNPGRTQTTPSVYNPSGASGMLDEGDIPVASDTGAARGFKINDNRKLSPGKPLWVEWYNYDKKKELPYPKDGWKYDREAKILYNSHMRVVRGFDFMNKRETVCSPETAIKMGWAACLPAAYKNTYQSVKGRKEADNIASKLEREKATKKMEENKECMVCAVIGGDNCIKCNNKSHWRAKK